MAVNSAVIDRADSAARDGGDDKSPVFSAGRKELHGVARLTRSRSASFEPTITEYRVVAKIVEGAVHQLVREIGRLNMQSRLDPEKIDGGIFKSRAGAERATQDRRGGHHVGKLSAHAHDFADS